MKKIMILELSGIENRISKKRIGIIMNKEILPTPTPSYIINFIILLLFFVRKQNKQIKKIISVEVISSKGVPGWPSHEANISKGKIKTT